MRVPERAAAVQKRALELRRRLDPLQTWVEHSIFWQIWERVLENEFVDRSVALAAKAFVSLFPALIVLAAFAPRSIHDSILHSIIHRTGLSGPGLATVKGAFASTDDVRKATGILGLVFTFFYINSFTAALRRVYTKAWRRPAGGRASAYAIGAGWLVGLVAYFALLGGLRVVLGNGPRLLVFAVAAWLATIGIWWLTPWLMLQRQVRLRVLLSGAVLTGTGMSVYAASAQVWMPTTVSQNQQQFGFFGVALALVTWLSGAAIIIVVSACAAPVLVDDTGWVGRIARGANDESLLAVGAPAALPPPIRALTISDALGAHHDEDERAGDVP